MTRAGGPISVVVVDDSPTARELLVGILHADPAISVVGTAEDGRAAIAMVKNRKPDIVTMDAHMPGMDGFEATRVIMENHPLPIVMVSGAVDTRSVEAMFSSMEAGALALIRRPAGPGAGPSGEIAEFLAFIKAMAEVKVVRRWPRFASRAPKPGTLPLPAHSGRPVRVEVVAIGASTGGPLALKALLGALSADFPVPLLIVQHMAEGFMDGFVEWLGRGSGLRVALAREGDCIRPGHAYVAPNGMHMRVDSKGILAFDRGEPVNGSRPSISRLFAAVSETYGDRALGVILTGMGRDGAEELCALRNCGAVTIAQDEETSVVHGMPGEAIRMGGATHVLPLESIPAALEGMVIRR